MTKALIAEINRRIENLQDQIDDLVNARRIVEEMMSTLPKARSMTQPNMSFDTSPVKSKKWHPDRLAPMSRGPHVQKKLIEEIRVVLGAFVDPMTSASIMRNMHDMFNWTGKKQRIWAALSVMKKRGMITHDKDAGTYRLIEGSREHGTSKVS